MSEKYQSLSLSQKRYWYELKNTHLSNNQVAYEIKGHLDTKHLSIIFEYIIERYPVLTSSFADDKERLARIENPNLPQALHIVDHTSSDNPAKTHLLIRDLCERDFDPLSETLFRFTLIKQSEQLFYLVLALHPIVADKFSLNFLCEEISTLYTENQRSSDVPQQFKMQIARESQYKTSSDYQVGIMHWVHLLGDKTHECKLPLRSSLSERNENHQDSHQQLPSELHQSLAEYAKRHQCGLKHLLLAAYAIMLSRFSSDEDIRINYTLDNHTPEQEFIVGCNDNRLAYHISVNAKQTIHQLLRHTESQAQRNNYFSRCSTSQIVRGIRESLNDRFSGIFSNVGFEETLLYQIALKNVDINILNEYTNEPNSNDLTLYYSIDESEIHFHFAIKPKYSALLKEQCAQYFIEILTNFIKNDQQHVGEISLFNNKQQKQMTDSNHALRRDYARETTVDQVFDRIANQYADRIAVIDNDTEITYQALQQRVNALAHTLQQHTFANNQTVPVIALYLTRSIDAVVAMLACLKAGYAYTPISSDYPDERIDYILNDTQAELIISSHGLITERSLLKQYKTLLIDQWSSKAYHSNTDIKHNSQSAAYIIYTSGSTGKPKGVTVCHRGINRLVLNNTYCKIQPGDRIAHASSIAFDAATFEVYGALLNGATLVVFNKETILSSTEFHHQLHQHKIDTLWLTVALFNQFAHEMPEIFAELNYLLVGGDTLNPEMIHRVNLCPQGAPNHIINGYGPTETTTFAVSYDIPKQQSDKQAIPIGYPIANTSCYVLSPEQQLTPHGFVGELYIGGDGVANGYLNDSEKTNHSFIKNPFVVSGDYDRTLYRSGDLVKRNSNGLIEFVGRADNQIKIRGYRIEIGEVEQQLLSYPAIDDAIVITHKPDNNEKSLAAFFVAKQTIDTSTLITYLEQNLPSYMIPEAFKQLNQFPLTANGKVDKKQLINSGNSTLSADVITSNKNLLPIVSLLFAKVLNIKPTDVHAASDFFELGGHSLKATQLVAYIRQELSTDISVKHVFELRTPQGIVSQIESNKRDLKPQFRMKKMIPGQVAPVSYQMSRGWYLYQMHKSSPYYNLPFEINFDQTPDPLLLREAVTEVLAQHDIFNVQYGEQAGQLTLAYRPKPIHIDIQLIHDDQALDDFRQQFTKTVFALDKQQSHTASIVSCRHSKTTILFFNIHHNFFDGWSIALFMRELSRIYHQLDNNLPVTKVEQAFSYRDYAYTQYQWQQAGAFDSQLSYWKKTLSGNLPVLKMPSDFERPQKPTAKGGQVNIQIEPALANKLRHLAKHHGVSVFTLLLTAYAVFLHKYTEQEELMIGTPIANRNLPDLENIIGCFVNTIAYRIQINPNMSVLQLLENVHHYGLSAMENQEVPFDKVTEHLEAEHHAGISYVFQTVFSFQSGISLSAPWLNDTDHCHIKQWPCGGAKFDLALILYDMADGSISGDFEYCHDLYRHETVATYAKHYTNLLERLTHQFDVDITHLSLLTRPQRLQLVDSLRYQHHQLNEQHTITQRFKEIVQKNPNLPAISDHSQQLTYQQLNELTDRIATTLQPHIYPQGYCSNQMVGLCVGRTVDIANGMFGIFKSGAAFFPIDPAHPKTRIQAILEQSQVKVVLTDEQHADLIQSISPTTKVITLSSIDVDLPIDYKHFNQPDDLAYTIFTSGSTGTPKGVLVEHKGIPLFAKALGQRLDIKPGTVCSQLGSLNFDGGLSEFFIALLNGAHCIIAEDQTRKNPDLLLQFFNDKQIEVSPFIPPALLEVLPTKYKPAKLRALVIAGDTCAESTIQYWSEVCMLVNGYGPSETSIGATYHTYQAGDHPKNIGKPLDHIDVYVLDKSMNPQPPGLVGEMYIGGDDVLARGYLNRTDITVKTFVTNPFNDNPNSLLYKTGDLVKQLPCGDLIFIGRNDALVKLRGYRIELGEIETILNRHAAIKQSIVSVMKINDIEQLVAHYVVNEAVSVDELRSTCSSHLPDYMVPNFFVAMDAMEVNINGKIDRHKLPLPSINQPNIDDSDYSDIAKKLLPIWQQYLGPMPIRPHDNFFQLGGNSFTSIRLLQTMNTAFNCDISATEFLALPTIAACEKLIRGDANPSDNSVIDQATEDAQLQLTHYNFKHTDSKSNILLTGANGFVGIHLLQALLLQYPDTQIYCLIRGNNEQALNKLIEAAEKYNIDLTDRSRIHILAGDLSHHQLGLSDSTWLQLSQTIDCIVHNGAQVHHLYDYHTLKPANVDSTLALIHLANQGIAKQLHYISTLSAATTRDKNGKILEQISHDKPPFTSGYLLSKWVAEQLVHAAFQQGLQGNIYRLGNITGHSTHGYSNYQNNHALLLLKACCQLQAAPDWSMNIDMVPVDIGAKLVVEWLLHPAQQVMHLSNPNQLSWQDYIAIMQQANTGVRLIPMKDWQAKLQHIDEHNALFPFKDMYLKMDNARSNRPTIQTDAIQRQLSDQTQQQMNCKQLAKTYIAYLQKEQFIN